jgi:hypothetical protein
VVIRGHVENAPEARSGGEAGDDGDRAAVAERVGGQAGDEAAEDVAHVAPEAVDADDRSALDRGDGV